MKKALLSIGIGAAMGFVVGKCIKKAIKNKPVEEQQETIDKTKKIVKGAAITVGTAAIIADILNTDDKIRMNTVVNTLHYYQTGFFDEEATKYAITTLFPNLSRKAKKAVYPLVQEAFPGLVEVR